MSTFVYADNAATTKMSPVSLEAMLPYMESCFGNPSSLHSAGQKAKEALTEARGEMAALLGCSPKEIYFTSGGSEADNQAILSAAALGARKGKKHILSTAFEHHAVLHTLEKLKREGFQVELLDVHSYGNISSEEVKRAIREDTCLVTVMYANNEIGSVLPIGEIGEVCREKGVIFHTDAVQAAGHLPIDVGREHIDMLSLSAHKFEDVKFETFGCGSAIASSSMATEMIKGKSIHEAMALTNKAVAEALDGLPAHKLHCSVLAEEAIKKALQDYFDRKGIPYDEKDFPACEHCAHCESV